MNIEQGLTLEGMLEISNQNSDTHLADNFEAALSSMSFPNPQQDFMVFPMDKELFNLNISISNNSSDMFVEVFTINEAPFKLFSFFKTIGNDDHSSASARLKLSEALSNIYTSTSSNYEVLFKIFAKSQSKINWHKDMNDESGLPMYNIGIALTKPGTWFCKALETDRFRYDNNLPNEVFNASFHVELETKCANELFYQVPDFSGVIFRSSDDFSAIHTPPPTGYRLFVLVELTPKNTLPV